MTETQLQHRPHHADPVRESNRKFSPGTVGRRSAAITLLITAPPATLTLVVALVGIGSRSLWNDEYATWYAATLSWRDLFRLLHHVDAVLAPYYVAMHGWIVVFGDSPTSLRIPSATAMAATAAIVALIGRRLFDAPVGFAAGLVFAGLPAVLRYGQEGRPYAIAITAVALATLGLLRAIAEPSWRRWLYYGGCLAIAGLLHIVTLTVLPAHAVLVWRALRNRDDFRMVRWIGAVVIAVTFALPLASKGAQQASAIAWIKADANAVRNLPGQLFGSWQVALLVVVAAGISMAMLWSTHRDAVALLMAWAVFPPVFCYLTFPLLHLFLHRYLLFTLPAWALLVAAVGLSLGRLLPRAIPTLPLSLSALLVVAAVCYVGASGRVEARRSPVAGEPDFRAAAAALAHQWQAGDGIAFAGVARNGRRPFGYEWRGRAMPRDVFVERTSQQNGEFGVKECITPAACLKETRRIWLVSATAPEESPFAGMSVFTQSFLEQSFTMVNFQHFEHVRILILYRKEGL